MLTRTQHIIKIDQPTPDYCFVAANRDIFKHTLKHLKDIKDVKIKWQ